MNRRKITWPAWGLAMIGVGAAGGGCDVLNDLLVRNVRVTLINDGDFPVEVMIFIDDEQTIPEDVLTGTDAGEEIRLTVPAGETGGFVRNCDDLQALIIDNAALNLVGEIGPETDTGVLRDSEDFNCGDEIVFTFDHSDLIVDFDVSISVERGGAVGE